MARSIHIRSLVITSAFAAASLALFAHSGQAKAMNVLKCEGASRQSVVECCETIVMRKGMPLWMKQTGRNCRAAARCVVSGNPQSTSIAAVAKRCRIYALIEDDGNSRQRRGRDKGPNGNAKR